MAAGVMSGEFIIFIPLDDFALELEHDDEDYKCEEDYPCDAQTPLVEECLNVMVQLRNDSVRKIAYIIVQAGDVESIQTRLTAFEEIFLLLFRYGVIKRVFHDGEPVM
ncbi:hypothetical protein, partial [Desulfococcus sp.]|uniref:hypothetical protein n=1 Tax=Desulfococcus sp. TaxID=2025834 RepID=UPI003D14A3B0